MEHKEPYDSSRSHQDNNSSGQHRSQHQQFKAPYDGQKLPGDPLAITLGIVSLVLFFTLCWCYGVVSIVTLVLSIAGLVVANKNITQYNADPERYSFNTYKSVQNAKIISIIGTIISGLVTLLLLVLLIFFGSIFFAIMDGNWDKFDELNDDSLYNDDSFYEEYEESTTDDWQYYENDTIPETIDSTNTLQIDAIPVE